MSNNKTKLFLLFTLIFIATIGLSAATAADIDNDATDVPVVAETPATDVVDVQTTDVDNKKEITKNIKTDVKTEGESEEKAKTSISFDPVENVRYLDNFTIKGTLQDEEGNGLNGQNITIKLNGNETTVTTKSGQFSINATAKIVGVNTITASYDGPKYAASKTIFTFTVEKAKSMLLLDDVDPVARGNVTMIGVRLVDNENTLPNQVIKIVINGNARKTLKTDENGEFYFIYTTSRAGDNTLNATFEGNDYYEGFSREVTFQVARIATSLNFDTIENVTKGRVTTISGNLTDENNKTLANKQIRFTINNSTKTLKTDDNGRFSFNYTFSKVGEINITGFYNGTEYVYDQIETNLTINVTKANVTMKIDVEENIPLGSNAKISVTLNTTGGEPAANVQVKITINENSTKTLKTDENGVVTLVFKMTKQGLNSITVSSIANNMFTNATDTVKVSVNKAE